MLGDATEGMTMDLFRRRVGEVFVAWVRWIDEAELNELAGVYCEEAVLILDGVENKPGARSVLAVPGERCPEPLDEGCDPGGDDWGGVPRVATGVPTEGSFSKNVSSS